MKIKHYITTWLNGIFDVCRKEFYLTFHDVGVIVFFVVLGLVYPVLYSLIYNTETVRDVPVVVVDNDRSQLSRAFARSIDATPEARVIGYAASMEEARHLLHSKECYGIVTFARDFSAAVARGEQGHVSLYADMGLLMRYKQLLMAVTNVQQEYCSRLQKAAINVEKVDASQLGSSTGSFGASTSRGGTIIESRQVPVGNTGMGIASAILPAVLVLVLQQSMLLGICMLRGGSRERRLRYRGRDPHDVGAPVSSTIVGKTLCYLLIYLLPTIYALFIVPIMFDFPQNGNPLETLAFMFPYLLCASFMGQSLQVLVNERESTFLVLVFTSVIFIFLSGISWPRYAMSPLWVSIGNMIPSTWACNGYIMMHTGGATLDQVAHSYHMLWGLAAFYFVIAYVVERVICRPRYKRMEYYASLDPQALLKEEAFRNGVDHFGHFDAQTTRE